MSILDRLRQLFGVRRTAYPQDRPTDGTIEDARTAIDEGRKAIADVQDQRRRMAHLVGSYQRAGRDLRRR